MDVFWPYLAKRQVVSVTIPVSEFLRLEELYEQDESSTSGVHSTNGQNGRYFEGISSVEQVFVNRTSMTS